MMNNVFIRFNELFTERSKNINPLQMGEDSVRYDFFIALMEILKLNSWDIQLEYPVHENSFIPRKHPKSKRSEKPQLDLYIKKGDKHLCAEFGLFRQNSNEKGNINKTERLAKMTKDLIRLSLHSINTDCKSYFVCVADDKMCGHQLDCKVFDPFPADIYKVTETAINSIKEYVKFDIDERFFSKFCQANITIEAKKIFDKPVTSPRNTLNTRTLVWEIKSVKSTLTTTQS